MYGFTVHVKVRVEENPVTTPLRLSPVELEAKDGCAFQVA
jgi:hypothetical protein